MATPTDDIPEEELQKLVVESRQQFISKHADATPNKYDSRDVERIRRCDSWIKHFLMHQKHSVVDAVKMMDSTLAWRKDFGVNDITEDNLPMEAKTLGAVFYHSKNLTGCDILYFSIKLNKKGDVKFNKMARMMIAYLLDTYQRKNPLRKVVALLDMTSVGLTNVDIELTKFLITCFTTYFPGMLEYLLVYEMPWIINTVWAVIKLMLSEEQQKKVLFCKKNSIQQYIHKDQLFPHMGGTDTYTYTYVQPLVEGSDEEDEGNVFQDSEDVNEPPAPRLPQASLPDIAQQVPASADDTPSTSGAAKKQVNWSNTDEVREFSEPSPSPTESRNNSISLPSTSTATSGSSSPPKSSSYKITIVPTSELQFTRPGINQEASCSIKLTNERSVSLAYKVRTTDPKNYRVKQGRGMLAPGHSEVVHVTLLAGQEIKRDKFLVLSTKLNSDNLSQSELSAHWKNTAKSQIHEHKLRCHEAALDLDTSVLPVVTEVPSLTHSSSSFTSQKSVQSSSTEGRAGIESRLDRVDEELKKIAFFLKVLVGLLVLILALLAHRNFY